MSFSMLFMPSLKLRTLAETLHQFRDFFAAEEQQYDQGYDDDFACTQVADKQ